MSEMGRTVLVRITGRVQGVCFRDWTRCLADDLGLVGWVRNRLDDSVEACFSGSREKIGEMIEKCQDGPRWSHVDGVVVIEEHTSTTNEHQTFEIRQTC